MRINFNAYFFHFPLSLSWQVCLKKWEILEKALTKIPLAEGEAAAAEAGVQFSKEEVKWGIPPSVLTPTHLSAAHYTIAPESAPPRKRGARKRELS